MRRRLGRPGIIGSAVRTAATTAVVVGTTNAMTGGRRRAMAEPQSSPQPQTTEAAPSGAALDDASIAKLKELADLKAQGILTEEEFEMQKARLLSS